ncbi:MAG: hypothetical protein JW871_03870 [Endomicrobiales bacterium]|nr:hypothetical protein [Endomicrobiales bacterium]
MKQKLILVIISCLILNPFSTLLSVDFQVDTVSNPSSLGTSFFLSKYISDIAVKMLDSMMEESSLPNQEKGKHSRKPVKPEKDSCLVPNTNNLILKASRINKADGFIKYADCSRDLFNIEVIPKSRYKQELWLFTLFMLLFYLLPRGAIDSIIMSFLNKRYANPIYSLINRVFYLQKNEL